MAVSNIKAEFTCEAEKVWEVVTSLEQYSWRRDLGRIEVLKEGEQFIEYTKDGYATTFTITAFEPCQRYEFDMENSNMQGHWVGILTEQDGKTSIDFTEDVTAKKWFMKPFVRGYLKKQQAAYVADLQKALESLA